jgi:hypothetical protein
LETAKECVTTHLPNQLALKMDGARASGPYSAATDIKRDVARQVVASRRVATVALKVSSVDSPGAAVGVDLGGSSKYSSENLED